MSGKYLSFFIKPVATSKEDLNISMVLLQQEISSSHQIQDLYEKLNIEDENYYTTDAFMKSN